MADAYLADKEQVMQLVADGNGPLYEEATSIIGRWKKSSAAEGNAS